ncbi:GNAT family N-acetyltransferase [Candidatus Woesearchaeota archaeon]|nr:GNAT family N-acetyltransferase [Candidatus Woesearchaeota archaeon]
MKIIEVPIGSRKDNVLWAMINKEWPVKYNDEFKAQLSRYAKDKKFFTAAIVIVNHGKVIGGCHLSAHPLCLKGFLRRFPSLKDQKIVRAEDFVIAPELRGRGIGEKFLAEVKKKYLAKFAGIIFHSRMPYVQEFYLRMGAKMLFDGRKSGEKWKRAYGRKVLRERSVFLIRGKRSK